MSFAMEVLNLPTQNKMNDMFKEGKLDQSVMYEFDSICKAYSAAKNQYKADRGNFNKLKDAKEKQIVSAGLKPLVLDKKYRELNKKYNAAKDVMQQSKQELKNKLRALRHFKKKIREQYKAVKENKKVKEMYAAIKDPNNSKYLAIFQPQNIDTWMQNYTQSYDKSHCTINKQGELTVLHQPEYTIDKSGAYSEMKKAYAGLLMSKAKEQARQKIMDAKQKGRDAIDAFKDMGKNYKTNESYEH
ncbi:MAG: hypothetical protein IKR04_03970 [Clostridia bacterium]|nr:hypothetical protein [Clostridia bacterium]